MDIVHICRIMKALSESNRLSLYLALHAGESCVCELLDQFSITQPTLSHHMKILSEALLVTGRREGKWIYYSVNQKTLAEFRQYLNSLETNVTSKKNNSCH